MNRGFHINFRYSAGNLHIHLAGEFNGMCAWELIKTIKRQPIGSGRVFVNTTSLNYMLSDGIDLFNSHITRKKIPPDWLYFKGENGFKIAPNSSRVLICKKARPPGRLPVQHPSQKGCTIRILN